MVFLSRGHECSGVFQSFYKVVASFLLGVGLSVLSIADPSDGMSAQAALIDPHWILIASDQVPTAVNIGGQTYVTDKRKVSGAVSLLHLTSPCMVSSIRRLYTTKDCDAMVLKLPSDPEVLNFAVPKQFSSRNLTYLRGTTFIDGTVPRLPKGTCYYEKLSEAEYGLLGLKGKEDRVRLLGNDWINACVIQEALGIDGSSEDTVEDYSTWPKELLDFLNKYNIKPEEIGEKKISFCGSKLPLLSALAPYGSRVRNLSLYGTKENPFTSETLTLLESFPNLTALGLGWNNLKDDDLKYIRGFKNLRELYILRAPITDVGLSHIQDLDKLTRLELYRCRITDDGLQYLSGLKDLKNLVLCGSSKVTGAGLDHLRGLTKLTELKLDECHIENDDLLHVRSFENLRSLHLIQCPKVTDSGLQHLSDKLTALDITGCNITNNGLAHVQKLRNLRKLALWVCPLITGAGLKHIEGLQELRKLILRGDTIGDEVFSSAEKLNKLTYLRLSKCTVTDSGFKLLPKLTHLTELVLDQCRVTNETLGYIKAHNTLEKLELYYCNVSVDMLEQGPSFGRALKELCLWRSNIRGADLGRLQAMNPGMKIVIKHCCFPFL